MSEANTEFRQQLTQSMFQARVESVAAEDRASYYRRPLTSLRNPGGATLGSAEIDTRLDAIVTQAKSIIPAFNALYDEISWVSLRAAVAMVQTDKPVTTEVYREFTL